jgi:hypothetical protein
MTPKIIFGERLKRKGFYGLSGLGGRQSRKTKRERERERHNHLA